MSPIFDLPFNLKFSEYNMVAVRIPDNKALILSLMFNVYVNSPAKVPRIKVKSVLIIGEKPVVMNLANINAPIGNVPSTDISAKSSILNVIITPIANTEKIKPCSIDVRINVFIQQILLLQMLCVLLPAPDFLLFLN